MEFLLNRYRNLTVLLVVIAGQLILIAYQVKSSKDVPLIRVWAVTAVTPIEHVLEVVRRNTWGFVEEYFMLLHIRSENDRLRKDIGQLKLDNQYLRTELATADRARALGVFQARSPSKTLAARIIGNGTGANSKAVFVDRGSVSGVEAGMAVVTPDGIVGKVVASYPTASLILLITDANFAAGVISQKNRVHGTLKGQGHDGTVLVDYIQNEEKIDPGEWFYTSGDDRIFPKGFPVGQVTALHNGRNIKEIYVSPSGFQSGLEEVLIVLNAIHQEIPDVQMAGSGYKLLKAPPEAKEPGGGSPLQPSSVLTEADKLKEQYRQVGVAEKHVFGEGVPGSAPPDFTKMGASGTAANAPAAAKQGTTAGPAGSAAAPVANAAAVRPVPAATNPPGATPVRGTPAPGASTAPNRARELADSTAKSTPATGSAPSVDPAVPPAVAAKPKPRPTGPLLVTDPNDADPTEPAPPPNSRPSKASRPREPELNEFGEPRPPQKTLQKRPIVVDGNTEILPPAAPPRSKAKPPPPPQ